MPRVFRNGSALAATQFLFWVPRCAAAINTDSFVAGENQWHRYLDKPWWAGDTGKGREDKDHIDVESNDSDSSSESAESSSEYAEDDGDRSPSGYGNRPLELTPAAPTLVPTQGPTATFPVERARAPTASSSAAADPKLQIVPTTVPVVANLVLDLSPIVASYGTMDANVVERFESACEMFVSETLPSTVQDASCRVQGQEVLLPKPGGPGVRRAFRRKRKLETGIASTVDKGEVTDATLRVDVSIGGQVPACSALDFQDTLVALFRVQDKIFLSLLKEDNNVDVTPPKAISENERTYFNTVESVLMISGGGSVLGAYSTNADASNVGMSPGLVTLLAILGVLITAAVVGVGRVLGRRRKEANQRARAAAPRMRPKCPPTSQPKRSSTSTMTARGDGGPNSSDGISCGWDGSLAPNATPSLADEDTYNNIDGCRDDELCRPIHEKCSGIGISSFKYEDEPISVTDDHDLTAEWSDMRNDTNSTRQSNSVRGSICPPSCSMTLGEASAVPPSLAHESQSMLFGDPSAVSSTAPANVEKELASLSLPPVDPSILTDGDGCTDLSAPPTCDGSMALSGAHTNGEASAVPHSLAHDIQSMQAPSPVSSGVPVSINNDLVSLSLPPANSSILTNGDDSTALGAPPACGDSVTLSGAHTLGGASFLPPSLAHDIQSPSAPLVISLAATSDVDNDLAPLPLLSVVPSLGTDGDDSTAFGAPSAFSVAAITVASPIPIPRDQAMSTGDSSVPQCYTRSGTDEEGCPDREEDSSDEGTGIIDHEGGKSNLAAYNRKGGRWRQKLSKVEKTFRLAQFSS